MQNAMDRYGSVIRVAADTPGRIYQIPDPTIPQNQRDPKWYVDNLKFACTFFNQWRHPIVGSGNISNTVTPGGSNSNSTASLGVSGESPIENMLRMMSYYAGFQPNQNYNHLTKNITTTNLMPSWIAGQKIYSVINVMKDVVGQMINNIDFDIENLSDEAQVEKKNMLDKLMIQRELRDYLGEMAKMGVNISSANGQNFEMPEDIQHYIDTGYKTMDEDVLIKIARSIWLTCGLEDKYMQGFLHAVTAGRCGIEHTVINGKYKPNLWMPYELIVDNRVDDIYNRYANFVGAVKYYTPQELFALHTELQEEPYKKEILDMASQSSQGAPFNTMNNLTWWFYGSTYQAGSTAEVTVYFKTLRDIGRNEFNERFGQTTIVPVQENQKGDYQVEDICQATLVGNRFLVDYGYCKNVQEDFWDKSKVRLPISVYIPDMLNGYSRSITARMSDLSDERDAMRFKIRESVGHSAGKVHVIKGWKFGNQMSQKEMSHDFKTLGFTVLASSGEAESDVRDTGDLVEMLDMTLDPNVLRLQEIIAVIDQEMLEIAKVSQSSLGNDQVQKYMGLGVQQQVMQSGSGNSTMYANYMNFIQMNMQYASDCTRYLLTEDKTDYPEQVIGKRGVEYLKVAKSVRYTNPLLYLIVEPFITAEQRNRLLMAADRGLAADKLDFTDYIQVEKATTLLDIQKKLEVSAKKKQARTEHEQAMMQQLQQIAQQNNELQQQNIALINQSGQTQRAQLQAQNKMDQASLKYLSEQSKLGAESGRQEAAGLSQGQ